MGVSRQGGEVVGEPPGIQRREKKYVNYLIIIKKNSRLREKRQNFLTDFISYTMCSSQVGKVQYASKMS